VCSARFGSEPSPPIRTEGYSLGLAVAAVRRTRLGLGTSLEVAAWTTQFVFEEDAETREVKTVDLETGEYEPSADAAAPYELPDGETLPVEDDLPAEGEWEATEADNGIEVAAEAPDAADTPPQADASDADYERWLGRDPAGIDQLVGEASSLGDRCLKRGSAVSVQQVGRVQAVR